MASQQIPCNGEHLAYVTVGTVDVPADAADPTAALTGYLCEDCGAAYPVLEVLAVTPIGQWNALLRAALLAAGAAANITPPRPTQAQVTAILNFLNRPRVRPH